MLATLPYVRRIFRFGQSLPKGTFNDIRALFFIVREKELLFLSSGYFPLCLLHSRRRIIEYNISKYQLISNIFGLGFRKEGAYMKSESIMI